MKLAADGAKAAVCILDHASEDPIVVAADCAAAGAEVVNDIRGASLRANGGGK